MRYVRIEDCQRIVFPYIHQFLTAGEKAPAYEKETAGIEELGKVLDLVQRDVYYPTFADKAAYVFCGIVGSQYFSNGNKRLGLAVLLMFLILNRAEVLDLLVGEYRQLLVEEFPAHAWEANPNIGGAHSLFLYNLAFVAGDRARWGVGDFGVLRLRVAAIFLRLYRMPSSVTSSGHD